MAAPASYPSSPNSKTGIFFSGYHCVPTSATQINADTWYPQVVDPVKRLWFSSWTDGATLGLGSGSGGDSATTGWAIMRGGASPADTQVISVGKVERSAAPMGGRYPCAPFSREGVLYYGTYALSNGNEVPRWKKNICNKPNTGGWCVGGPFIGFHYSTDNAVTWAGDERLNASAEGNIFRQRWPVEPEQFYFKVMQPHAVDVSYVANGPSLHGDVVYFVSHGCGVAAASPPEPDMSYCGWIQGDSVVALRLTSVSPTTVNDANFWEIWTGAGWENVGAGGLANAAAIVHEPHKVGVTNVVWVPQPFGANDPWLQNALGSSVVAACFAPHRHPGGAYVLFTTAPSVGNLGAGKFTTRVYVGASPCGPWKLLTILKDFGTQGYFVHAPGSYLSNATSTSVTGFLWYSANYAKTGGPTGSGPEPVPAYCNFSAVGGGDHGNCYGSVTAQFTLSLV